MRTARSSHYRKSVSVGLEQHHTYYVGRQSRWSFAK